MTTINFLVNVFCGAKILKCVATADPWNNKSLNYRSALTQGFFSTVSTAAWPADWTADTELTINYRQLVNYS